jgi:uncharacterized protein YbjT (DUF2867 family)
MKLIVIGGTGKTGRKLIEQGLARGHKITAIVRNAKTLKFNNPNLRIVKGDVLIPESLESTFKGQDAVLCTLGHKRFFIKTTILSRGTQNIINAMNKNGVNRFICTTSLGINDSRFKLGIYYTLFTIPVILFFYFLDKSKQEKIIIKSGLDWTIVRPAQLTNGKKRTKYKHDTKAGHYILTKTISRASVAHFMLKNLESTRYLRKAVGVTN